MPEADAAFAARCLLRAARVATLATQSGGQPFASLVTPAVAPDGAVLLLLSGLAAHTHHLLAEPRCALLVAGKPAGANPQTTPRLTVTGMAQRDADPAWRDYWLARHPYAALYAGCSDFAVWRIVPAGGHFVGGFAQAHTLPAAALAAPSPAVQAIGQAAARIISHCNTGHAEALSLLARDSGGSGIWRMLGVDPDGFDLVQGESVLRVAFDAPAQDAPGVRAALVRLIQERHIA